MKDLEYFPKDYSHARARFLSQAAQLKTQYPNLEFGSQAIPSKKDQDLFVDWLYLPATSVSQRLLTLTSGVHGVEAYVGVAIQSMFIEELIKKAPLSNTGVLIFHCMNPFGFKNHRRSTEGNVNLNRNFSMDPSLFGFKNKDYQRLARYLKPQSPTGGSLKSLWATAKVIAEIMISHKLSIAEFIQSVAGGQFEHKDGLEFGGFDLEPQSRFFISELKKRLEGYRDLIHFDLHTGLGDRFAIHLIPSTRPETLNQELADQLFKTQQDAEIYEFTPQSAEGFYETRGDLNNMLPDLVKNGQRIAAVTVEYGTLGNSSFDKLCTFSRLIAENQAFHLGYESEKARLQNEKDYLELFYPSEIKWRTSAIRRARELFTRVLERMAQN